MKSNKSHRSAHAQAAQSEATENQVTGAAESQEAPAEATGEPTEGEQADEPIAETEPVQEPIAESEEAPKSEDEPTQEPIAESESGEEQKTEEEPTEQAPADGENAEKSAAPVAKRILYVDSPIKKALFDKVLRGELQAGGRWGTKTQENLAAPWRDIEVEVAEQGAPVGRNFDAQKTNWNFNDSNFVNPTANYQRLAQAAREANNGVEVPKKQLQAHLEDLKKICGKMVARAA